MPHIEIQHSDLSVNFRELLMLLVKHLSETFPTVIPAAEAVKARAINVHQDWAIGFDPQRQDQLGFAHTSVRVLAGQSEETLTAMGKLTNDVISAYMKEHLDYSGKTIQLTIEIGEIMLKPFHKTVLSSPAKSD